MQVGDLVRDTQYNDIGIVIGFDAVGGIKVMFPDGEEWLSDAFLEVLDA